MKPSTKGFDLIPSISSEQNNWSNASPFVSLEESHWTNFEQELRRSNLRFFKQVYNTNLEDRLLDMED